MAELGGEKIDVIEWSEDASTFVAKALSPAQVIEVRIDEEHRIANVVVPERMLSLAIGREGQNARLAAKLTGWRIDIRSDVSVAEAAKARPRADADVAADAEPPAEARSRAGRDGRAPRRKPAPRPHGRSLPRKAEPAKPKRRKAAPRSQAAAASRAAGEPRRPSRSAARPPSRQSPKTPGRCPRSPGRASAAVSDPDRASSAGRRSRSASCCASFGRPDGRVVVDPTGRLPGRGAYVCDKAGVPNERRSTKDRSSERWKCRSRPNSGPN